MTVETKNEIVPAEHTEKKGPPTANVGPLGIEIGNLETMWWLAGRVINSNLAPKDCKSQSDVFVRAQHGMAAGLTFMQGVQYVSNVNGRPCIWGPPLKGLILASGKCAKWVEEVIGDDPFKDAFTIRITVERRDLPGEQVVTFTTAMAKRAGLMGKDTYKQYPEDMLMYRAYGRVAKRHFPDVISGLIPAEDRGDIIDVTPSAEPMAPPRTLDEVAARVKAKPEHEATPDENGEIPDTESDGPQFGDDCEDLFPARQVDPT